MSQSTVGVAPAEPIAFVREAACPYAIRDCTWVVLSFSVVIFDPKTTAFCIPVAPTEAVPITIVPVAPGNTLADFPSAREQSDSAIV